MSAAWSVSYEDLDVLARTIYGEASAEPPLGRLAVAWVVLNRWRSGKWFAGKTVAATCRKRWQFSCWNDSDPNRRRIEKASLAQLRDSLDAALAALSGIAGDPTGGATHYYADYIKPPAWAKGRQPTVKIGRHLFFAGVD